MDKKLLIEDFEKNLNVKINNYVELKSDNGLVLQADELYIIKELNDRDFKSVKEFEAYYKFVKEFRKAIYISEEYNYMVYEYIEADRYIDYDKIKLFNQIYDVVKEERRIDSASFGYINEDNKTWFEFINDEIEYSKTLLSQEVKIDLKLVEKALKIVKKAKIEPYLIHGDLGVHNFIVKDKIIHIIDPIGVIGDYLYDFYSALLSSYSIAKDLDFDYIISYFDRKDKYKKALFVICYFIRTCRSYKYDKADFECFLKDFKYLSLK